MTALLLRTGVVVRDSYGRTGIVCEREAVPSPAWLNEQLDAAALKALGPAEWWGVKVLDGGFVLSPGPLLQVVREATYEDFLAAADTASVEGRARLAKMFPRYVERILAQRRK